jgi:toxin ParE1/3/4
MIHYVAAGLVQFPELGVAYSGQHPGLRSIKAKQHRIVYRIEPARIVVVRVLHASMDPKRHLG